MLLLVPFPLTGLGQLLALILVALLRYFAEFLKDTYALTFVFSTCSLVADWYSFLVSPGGRNPG